MVAPSDSTGANDQPGVNRVLLLDGGMGQELLHRGAANRTGSGQELWSAQALVSDPDAVRAVHCDYIRAGADVITTNTYATTRLRLERVNDPRYDFVDLNLTAATLAQQARDEVGRNVLIAGSLPPLNGSYRPDRVLDRVTLDAAYREQAEVLSPHVDLLLCETMSTVDEAVAAASAACLTGKPVWVAWTLADGGADHLRSGESIEEAWSALGDLPIEAALVNCCAPESISACMPYLAQTGARYVGGYANGFVAIPDDWQLERQSVDGLQTRQDLNPDQYARYAMQWIERGANVVGGCCEVRPAHIQKLAEKMAMRETPAEFLS